MFVIDPSKACASLADRSVRLGLFALLLIAVPLAHAKGAGEHKPPATWHSTAFVQGPMGIRVIDYWSKGSDMVARTLIGGRPITTIVGGGRYVAFDGITRRGIDVARSKRAIEGDRTRSRPFAFELEEIIRDGGEMVEEVRLGTRKGEVWQVRDSQGSRKVWVSKKEPRVPVRLQTFDRPSGETIEVDYQNWVFDMEIPDRFFTPPAGLALERLEYEAFLERSAKELVGGVPVLYPDLLHGTRAD